jgi:hypothetical protein
MLDEFPVLPPLGKGAQFLLSPTLKQVKSKQNSLQKHE